MTQALDAALEERPIAMTDLERAKEVFDAMCENPEIWATHGMPQDAKEVRIVRCFAIALAAARREGAAEILSSLSYPNRSALRESVRENLEHQYADVFGKRCSTDAARRLAECALEATVDFLRADAIRALKERTHD